MALVMVLHEMVGLLHEEYQIIEVSEYRGFTDSEVTLQFRQRNSSKSLFQFVKGSDSIRIVLAHTYCEVLINQGENVLCGFVLTGNLLHSDETMQSC